MTDVRLPLGVLMVWVPSLLFLVLAVVAHLLDLELFWHPLSFARDGSAATVGWAAFVALNLAIAGYSVVYLRASTPLRRYAVDPLVALVLMVFITVTPTLSSFHDGVAAFILLWVTVFFTVRFLDVSPWLSGGFFAAVVVGAGVLLLFSPQWSQKVLILVQVVVMNLDAHRVRLASLSRRVVHRSVRDL